MPGVLFSGATLWAGTPPRPAPGWLLVDGGLVAATGTTAPPAAGKVVDLRGQHLLPGFVDAHSHLTVSAWLPMAVDGSGWTRNTQMLDAIRRQALERPLDPWLLAMGADFDYWRDGMPSLQALDEAAGERPALVVDLSLHRCLASSAGLAALRGYAGAQGDIERRRGQPSGLLWESANAAALKTALGDLALHLGEQGLLALLKAEARRHLALGITACHDPCIPASMQPLMERLQRETPLRLSWSRVAERSLMEPADAGELCPHCGEGPSSAKLFMDGAHRCALCLEPSQVLRMLGVTVAQALRGNLCPFQNLLRYRTVYRRRRFYMPYLRMDTATLTSRLDTLAQHGVRPRIHALGNHAARCACDALSAVGMRDATLEHLTLLSPADMDAVAHSGAVASLQPGFIPHHGPSIMDRGALPHLHCLPLGSLQRRGVPLSISSDNPCGPLDPLHNLRMAVERRMPDGRVVDAREAVSIETAVAAYTTGGQRAISGSLLTGLAPGNPADLAVLSGHPLDPATQVTETWIAGQRVFGGGAAGTGHAWAPPGSGG
jgi:predicted amidohydrolase YtcJ